MKRPLLRAGYNCLSKRLTFEAFLVSRSGFNQRFNTGQWNVLLISHLPQSIPLCNRNVNESNIHVKRDSISISEHRQPVLNKKWPSLKQSVSITNERLCRFLRDKSSIWSLCLLYTKTNWKAMNPVTSSSKLSLIIQIAINMRHISPEESVQKQPAACALARGPLFPQIVIKNTTYTRSWCIFSDHEKLIFFLALWPACPDGVLCLFASFTCHIMRFVSRLFSILAAHQTIWAKNTRIPQSEKLLWIYAAAKAAATIIIDGRESAGDGKLFHARDRLKFFSPFFIVE